MSRQEAQNNMAVFVNQKAEENVAEERRLEAKAADLKKRSKLLDEQHQQLQALWRCVPVHKADGRATLEQIANQYNITVDALRMINVTYENALDYPMDYQPGEGAMLYLPLEGAKHYNKTSQNIIDIATAAAKELKAEAKRETESLRVGIMRRAQADADKYVQKLVVEANDAGQRIIAGARSEAEQAKANILALAREEAKQIRDEAKDRRDSIIKYAETQGQQNAQKIWENTLAVAAQEADSIVDRATAQAEKIVTSAQKGAAEIQGQYSEMRRTQVGMGKTNLYAAVAAALHRVNPSLVAVDPAKHFTSDTRDAMIYMAQLWDMEPTGKTHSVFVPKGSEALFTALMSAFEQSQKKDAK